MTYWINVYTSEGIPTGECMVFDSKKAADNAAHEAEIVGVGRLNSEAVEIVKR